MRLLLVVSAIVESFTKKAPLQRKAVGCIYIHDTVDTPTCRNVVEDYVVTHSFFGAEVDHSLRCFRFVT